MSAETDMQEEGPVIVETIEGLPIESDTPDLESQPQEYGLYVLDDLIYGKGSRRLKLTV